jgi:hypothetical protein
VGWWVGAGAAACVLAGAAHPALAAGGAGERPPPVRNMENGCSLDALDLFKETRAKAGPPPNTLTPATLNP